MPDFHSLQIRNWSKNDRRVGRRVGQILISQVGRTVGQVIINVCQVAGASSSRVVFVIARQRIGSVRYL